MRHLTERGPGSTTTLVLLLALVVLMIAPGTALAQPSTERISLVEFHAEGDEDGFNDCDGDGVADYTLDLEGTLTLITGPGATVRMHFNVDGWAFTSDQSALRERVRIRHAYTLTFEDGRLVMVTGLPFGMFEGHGGPIVMDAGLVVFSEEGIFVAGPHQLLEEFGFDPNAATCHALGLS